jgi:hypothetical protein
MTRLPLILPAALAACGAAGDDTPSALSAASPEPRAAKRVPAAEECPLTISFGSYAMGIDRPTLAAVESLLAREAAVTAVERRGRGREGEIALCVRLAGPAAAEPIARRIAALFPAQPRGPLRVSAGTGYVFEAPQRR